MSDITISVVQPPSTTINVGVDETLIIGAGISYPTHSITHISGGSDELNHNSLDGLQGGSIGGYYHISSNQYFNLTTGDVIRPSETGIFYTNDNLSGFITGVDLSSYSTIDYVSGVSGDLQIQISNLDDETGSYVLKSETGDFIITNQTGLFYAESNPSGFITGVDLSAYVTGDVVRPSQTGVFITQSQTGVFYTISNPSGFITGVDLSSYATINYTTGISGGLQTQVTSLNNQTGSYYLRTNPSGYITGVDLSFSGNYYTKDESESRYVNTTGTETILGDKTFHDKVYINNLYVTGLETIVNTTNTNVASNYIMLNLTGGAVDGGLFFVTGSGLTGINDSGAIIGFDHSDKFKFGISTRASDLSTLSTIASFEEVTGVSGNLQTQISTLNNQTGDYVLNINTGNFITSSQTGQFYASSNPSGFITGVDLSTYVLNSETGSFITSSQTGDFYSNLNPSGYITGINNLVYTTGDQTITGKKTLTDSFILQSSSNQLQLRTGEFGNTIFITTPAIFGNRTYTVPDVGTGCAFVLTAGPQTISGLKDFTIRPTFSGTNVALVSETIDSVYKTGNQIISGNKVFTTGLTIQTATNQLIFKTGDFGNSASITAPTISTNRIFTLPDIGTSAAFVVTAGVQTIGGAKNFSSRPTVNTTGVALVSEVVYVTGNQNVSGIKIFGLNNSINNSTYSHILGGTGNNIISGNYSIIGGGQNNEINQIGGASIDYISIVGGVRNDVFKNYGTIVGGQDNTVSGNHSFIGAGRLNSGFGAYSTIVGGDKNRIYLDNSVIAGGVNNLSSGISSSVGGGDTNSASSNYATIAGGYFNNASGPNSSICGGDNNKISTEGGFIGGGYNNSIDLQPNSTIGGGDSNTARGISSVVCGGAFNRTSGSYSVIAGGYSNKIAINTDYSSALGGRRALIISGHTGASVLSDGQDRDHLSRGANTCSLDFINGVYFRLPSFSGPSNQTGNRGEMAMSGDYLYVCTGTDGSGWARTQLIGF